MDALTPAVLAGLGLGGHAAPVTSGPEQTRVLAAPLAVADCAVASVEAALAAAGELAFARTGRRPALALSTEHIGAVVRSELWLRDPDGHALNGFAALSRIWPAADGWVRTHANYPWHRRALLSALGVLDEADDEVAVRLGGAISVRGAQDVEDVVFAAGGVAVASRSVEEWRATASAQAVKRTPLVDISALGDATPTRRTERTAVSAGTLPAAGLRVLDLTRVIAGPVATRTLASLGAQVLRLDDPARPELALHAVDGVIGKTSATVDLDTADGRALLHTLLAGADAVVTGYRPGALRRFGLDADTLAERHPGLVVANVSAWGDAGPWGSRRGFDSLVQIASGIGAACSPDADRPGALPCQLLDHGSGYLLAAGVLSALATRVSTGVASQVRVSLARTAQWLLDQGLRSPVPVGDRVGITELTATAERFRVPLGNGWSAIAPPGAIDGLALNWPALPPAYATGAPHWS